MRYLPVLAVFLAIIFAFPIVYAQDPPAPPMPPVQATTIQLQPGWNMLAGGTVSATDCAPGVLWHYDPASGSYQNDGILQADTQFASGSAYWYRASSQCTITFTGSSSVNNLNLPAGWNQLGGSSSVLIDDIRGTCTISGAYKYNPELNQYEPAGTTFDAGIGYFVRVSSNCAFGGTDLPPPVPDVPGTVDRPATTTAACSDLSSTNLGWSAKRASMLKTLLAETDKYVYYVKGAGYTRGMNAGVGTASLSYNPTYPGFDDVITMNDGIPITTNGLCGKMKNYIYRYDKTTGTEQLVWSQEDYLDDGGLKAVYKPVGVVGDDSAQKIVFHEVTSENAGGTCVYGGQHGESAVPIAYNIALYDIAAEQYIKLTSNTPRALDYNTLANNAGIKNTWPFIVPYGYSYPSSGVSNKDVIIYQERESRFTAEGNLVAALSYYAYDASNGARTLLVGWDPSNYAVSGGTGPLAAIWAKDDVKINGDWAWGNTCVDYGSGVRPTLCNPVFYNVKTGAKKIISISIPLQGTTLTQSITDLINYGTSGSSSQDGKAFAYFDGTKLYYGRQTTGTGGCVGGTGKIHDINTGTKTDFDPCILPIQLGPVQTMYEMIYKQTSGKAYLTYRNIVNRDDWGRLRYDNSVDTIVLAKVVFALNQLVNLMEFPITSVSSRTYSGQALRYAGKYLFLQDGYILPSEDHAQLPADGLGTITTRGSGPMKLFSLATADDSICKFIDVTANNEVLSKWTNTQAGALQLLAEFNAFGP